MSRKPQNKVKILWSPEFAYAIGVITTDGNLSPNGRTINITSKDLEMVLRVKDCLKVKNKIGRKARGEEKIKKYYVIQIGDINFYKYLVSIGLMPKKSKRLGELKISDKYFWDFLRGHFDGDGTFYYYWDPRWKSSFMFYTVFISASKKHVEWLQKKILKLLGVTGHLTKTGRYSTMFSLKFAKADSLKLLKKLYGQKNTIYLKRKYLKIKKCLSIIGQDTLI